MARQQIGFGEKVGYALGDTASNFFFQSINLFLMFYYTDIFGLDPKWAGGLMIAARVWDAISDPIMGAVADRTKTRWGRYRPYLLWLAVPYGIIGYLLFMNPELADMRQKEIYAAVTYIMMMTIYTAINIPYSALMGVMSSSSDERATLSTFRFTGAFGGALLVSGTAPILVNYFGGVTESMTALEAVPYKAIGFKHVMAIFSVISIACFLVTFFTTKERVTPPPAEKTTLAHDVSLLLKNKPWIVMWIAAIFTLTNTAVRNGAIIYYFKYYVGLEGAPLSVFYTVGGVAMLVGAASTKFFMSRWSKKTLMVALSIANAISMAVIFFIPRDQLVLLNVVNFVGTFLCGPTPALVWAMYTDTADYADWKFRRRATGLIFSSAMFAQKMGLALGGGLIGMMLGWFGFVANQQQSETSMLGIRLTFTFIPAAFMLVNALVMSFYPLSDEQVLQIEEELKARNEAESVS